MGFVVLIGLTFFFGVSLLVAWVLYLFLSKVLFKKLLHRKAIALTSVTAIWLLCFYVTSIHGYVVYRYNCSKAPQYELVKAIEPDGVLIHNNWTMPKDQLTELVKIIGYVQTETLYAPGVKGMKPPARLKKGESSWLVTTIEEVSHPGCDYLIDEKWCLASYNKASKSPKYTYEQILPRSAGYPSIGVKTFTSTIRLFEQGEDRKQHDVAILRYRDIHYNYNLLSAFLAQELPLPEQCEVHKKLSNATAGKEIFWRYFLDDLKRSSAS